MTLPLRMIAATALASLTALAPGATPLARAQGRTGTMTGTMDESARATLLAERQRVRAELDKVNLEIDALKRDDRGMREDYRLRARLADAEALARRLTEIDAKLGTGARPAAPRSPALGAEPTLAATDGPAEMDAKADILADQARRIGAEAQAVRQRAHELRARQDLRRRVGQMEQDPFSPLEGSKRRVTTAGAAPFSSRNTTNDVGSAGPTSVPTVPPPSTPAPGAGAAEQTGGSAPGRVTTQIGGGIASPAVPPVPTGGSGSPGTSPLTPQLRDLLDPATLGEVRRLESSGAPGANIEALERAAAALRARADRLQNQAQALRARAHAPR